MSHYAKVEFTDSLIVKTYLPEGADRFHAEVAAYTAVPWAAPRLLDADESQLRLVIERHIPILYLPKEETAQLRQPLWELVTSLHGAGWWHRDICLVNVVVDHGQPLLIDFENATPAVGPVAYDLFGAVRAGVTSAWGHPYSVHWFNDCGQCPERYWRDIGHRDPGRSLD